jgi:hypothetical protein
MIGNELSVCCCHVIMRIGWQYQVSEEWGDLILGVHIKSAAMSLVSSLLFKSVGCMLDPMKTIMH